MLSIERQPSLRDFAKELGVSHTTVALALKNDSRISFEVRKRVQAVANKRGYFVNDIPKNLFGSRSSFIGIAVPGLQDSFYARLLEGIQEQLWDAEKIPLVLSSHEDIDREETILERYARLRVDGIIFVPVQTTRQRTHFAEVLRKSTPLVTVERSIPSLALPQIKVDETIGAMRATMHLLETGCQRPAFCSSNLDDPGTVELLRKGYTEMMERAQLPKVAGHLNLLRNVRHEILAGLGQLLHLPSGDRVDSIVAASDDTAATLVLLLREMRIRVPDDIAITGFGNRGFRRNAHYDGPILTTMDLRPEKIGKEAALMLLNLRNRKDASLNNMLVEPQLVEGATTSRSAIQTEII